MMFMIQIADNSAKPFTLDEEGLIKFLKILTPHKKRFIIEKISN